MIKLNVTLIADTVSLRYRMIGSLIGRGSDPPSPTLRPTVVMQSGCASPKKTLRRKDKKRPSLSL